jgi:putative cell wall-binding protein
MAMAVVVVALLATAAGVLQPGPTAAQPMADTPTGDEVVLLTAAGLVTIDSDQPAVPRSVVPVIGDEDAPIVTIDVRPSTGQLYGLSESGQLYTVDLDGTATAVGAPIRLPEDVVEIDIDFNPVVDKIRVLASSQAMAEGVRPTQNLRVDPETAEVVATDPDLAYAPGDPSAELVAQVGGAAYTQPFDGTTATVLYGLDWRTQALVTQGTPDGSVSANTGQLFTVALDVDGVREFSEFDIGQSGQALFVGRSPVEPQLFSVDLADGSVTDLGPLPTSGTPAMAILPTVTRVDGPDRAGTAAELSRTTFDPQVPVAVLVSARDFPDGLTGGAAATAMGGPVLLAEADRIPAATEAELRRLQPGRLVVLGGTARISADVEAALAAYTDGQVTRLAGGDRYATAVAVSAATFGQSVLDPTPTVVVTTGLDFPDALAGGAAAGRLGGPVLLVPHDALPAQVADEIRRLGPETILIIGGEAAVSAAVEADLAALDAGAVRRIAGADRYATAAAAGEGAGTTVLVAVGTAFADALAGGAAAGTADAPLLLTAPDAVPEATSAALRQLAPTRVVVLGGTSVVSDEVLRDLFAAADS